MRSFQFIQELQKDLVAIDNGNANLILFYEPDNKLVSDLRHFALEILRNVEFKATGRKSSFIEDVSSRSIFWDRIRYCVIELHGLSIGEELFFNYISSAMRRYLGLADSFDSELQSVVINEIAKCFEPWYRPEDVFRMDFARQRQLLLFDSFRNNWVVSNVGRYVERLSAFDSIVFLCVLEAFLTLQVHKNKFLSKDSVEKLIKSYESKKTIDRDVVWAYSLRLFGIIEGYPSEKPYVTEFGYRILSSVNSRFDDLANLLMTLIETEIVGVRPVWSKDSDAFLKRTDSSRLLANEQKKSLHTAVGMAASGGYIDALKLMYPIFEDVIAQALLVSGYGLSPSTTLRPKLDEAVKRSLISSQLSLGIDIVISGRNRILHGNLSSGDPTYLLSLFEFIQSFFQQLLLELDSGLAKTKSQS
jgi:hypothetical protein